MDKEIESILKRTKEIKEIEGIEEWFEDYREEARTIIKKARKTHRKDIAKISLGLTKEQLEDFVIVEFMMADDWCHRSGKKWRGSGMDEPVFEDEEVLFSFEDKDFSVIVDFYGEEEWRIQSIAVWNKEKKDWSQVLINLGMQKRLTNFMDREIDSHGNNIFETAYTAKYEPTDWKDDYND